MSLMFISAGEASGDVMGAYIMEALQNSKENIQFAGVGGARMRSQDLKALAHAESLSAAGIVEAIPRIPAAVRTFIRCTRYLSEKRPERVILIDFPEMNMRILRRSVFHGISTFYVSPPQVWAWREKRLKHLRLARALLCILPFEKDYYTSGGAAAFYVGHPAVGRMEREEIDNISKDPRPSLAILPGSRLSEISAHMKILFPLVKLLRESYELKELSIIVAVAPAIQEYFESHFGQRIRELGLQVEYDGMKALKRAWWAVVASGTASLEASLVRTPSVIIYRISPISYAVGRKMIRVNYVGLPNILLGRKILPELLQNNANPQFIFEHLKHFMKYGQDAPPDVEEGFSIIRDMLGNRRFSSQVAEIILNAAP